MRVILLSDIKGLGRKYDIRNVSDGYARNFLFPRNLAKCADEESIRAAEKIKKDLEQKEKELVASLRECAEKLPQKEFVFELKRGQGEEIFGSVSREDIKKAVIKALPETYAARLKINLERPIKKTGTHRIEIDLGRGVKTEIKVEVHPRE